MSFCSYATASHAASIPPPPMPGPSWFAGITQSTGSDPGGSGFEVEWLAQRRHYILPNQPCISYLFDFR